MGVRLAAAFGLAVMAAGIAAAGAANIATNGSFELTPVTKKSRFAANVTGWSIGNASSLTYIDVPGSADNGSYLSVYAGFPATSPDGGNFVQADGDPGYSSTFSQILTGLTPGGTYTVNFYQAAGQQLGFTGPTTERWAVSLGAGTQQSAQFSLPQGGTGAWQKQALSFVADASSDVLAFLAVGTPGGAPPISFLDGVDVEAADVPATVPAPGVMATLGAGFLALAIMRRTLSRG